MMACGGDGGGCVWCSIYMYNMYLVLLLFLGTIVETTAYEYSSFGFSTSSSSSSFLGTRSLSSCCSLLDKTSSSHIVGRHHQYHDTTMSMKVRVGILGLPNVGKSTLFNALAQQSIAQAANYPFCTIDPNRAILPLPDPYLKSLRQQQHHTEKIISATLEWIDVAGLAKGAHKGEGLGNQFLATLRECQAICHVVRIFDDTTDNNSNIDAVIHVDGKVDPYSDLDTILLELILADLDHVERRLERKTKTKNGSGGGGGTSSKAEKEEKEDDNDVERRALKHVAKGLHQGIPARELGLTYEEEFSLKSMGLLTLKPMIYAFNVDEVDYTLGRKEAEEQARQILDRVEYCDPTKDSWTLVSAKLDAELSLLSKEEQITYWSDLGLLVVNNDDTEMEEDENENDKNVPPSLSSPSLSSLRCHEVLPKLVQQLLHLGVVYTGPGVPPERSRTIKAHLITAPTTIRDNEKSNHKNDDTAPPYLKAKDMAGRLHGDIQKGFICAEVTPASVLLQHSNYVAAKESGCVRVEGKEYTLQPNDVILIKWK